jgi:hypothetical protein
LGPMDPMFQGGKLGYSYAETETEEC